MHSPFRWAGAAMEQRSLLARSEDELRVILASTLNVFAPQRAASLTLVCRQLRGLLREPLAELKALKTKGVGVAAKLYDGGELAFVDLPTTAGLLSWHCKPTADDWVMLAQLVRHFSFRVARGMNVSMWDRAVDDADVVALSGCALRPTNPLPASRQQLHRRRRLAARR